jgi:hypothetical protein
MFPQRTPEQFLGQTADLIELVDTRYSDFNERTKWKAAERSPHYYFAEKATRQYGPDVPNWSAALIDTAMIGAQTCVFAAT